MCIIVPHWWIHGTKVETIFHCISIYCKICLAAHLLNLKYMFFYISPFVSSKI